MICEKLIDLDMYIIVENIMSSEYALRKWIKIIQNRIIHETPIIYL